MMMPKLDGIRATLKIREKNSIPIIILSAKSEDADKILGLNVGADDYVTKPFSPLELVARVKSQLRRYTQLGGTAQNENDKIYSVGGLRINDDLKEVTAEQRETLDKLIEKLPEGLDTIVSSETVAFSDGEKKRMGIARALLSNASVLIFDEPTASLDNKTKGPIMESIRNQCKNRILIVVTHDEKIVQPTDIQINIGE